MIYASCPSFEHPFNNHWQTDSEWPWMSASGVQLYFIFFLSMLAFIYQTFLSVLVFRVLCDVSVQYPAVHRGWRIKVELKKADFKMTKNFHTTFQIPCFSDGPALLLRGLTPHDRRLRLQTLHPPGAVLESTILHRSHSVPPQIC